MVDRTAPEGADPAAQRLTEIPRPFTAARETVDGAPGTRAHDLHEWLLHNRWPNPTMPVMPAPPVLASGAGHRIALLDAPVDTRHPDLVAARIQRWPATSDRAPDERATAFASLLVGQGHAHTRGLLPNAELLVAAVQPVEEPGADLIIAQAVRWSMSAGAEVIVMPFARRRLSRRVTLALHKAISHGIRVFASGESLGSDALAFPAAVTGVIAVAGHDGHRLLDGCSTHANFAAPGHRVPGAGSRAGLQLTGSSAAAVVAAGSHVAWCEAGARPEARRWNDAVVG